VSDENPVGDQTATAARNPNQTKKSGYRAGFVALVGQPNAGKSTLLNAILNEKLSIVSAKPQTTRQRVTGILNRDDAQIVFVDSPGTLKSTSGINTFLQQEVADVMKKADVVCALLAADASEDSVKDLLSQLERGSTPWIAVVTKVDILGGTRTPMFFNHLVDNKIPFVSISTAKRQKEAVEEVLARVIPMLPEAVAPLYDEDLYTTQTVRQIVAEFVREACFDRLQQEIPYGLAVRVQEFNEEGPVVKIRCELLLDKENHKSIVIGAKGATIKAIGVQARPQIERFLGQKVFLELHVAVQEGWTKNPRIMKELGYVVAKE
jgi:GTP-binding protein Era